MSSFEENVEKILALIGTLKRRRPYVPDCQIIDETEKPRGCVFCIPHLPRGRASECGCQIIEKE